VLLLDRTTAGDVAIFRDEWLPIPKWSGGRGLQLRQSVPAVFHGVQDTMSMHLGQISDSNLPSQVLPAPERAGQRSASRCGIHVLFDYCPTMKIALSEFFEERAKI